MIETGRQERNLLNGIDKIYRINLKPDHKNIWKIKWSELLDEALMRDDHGMV